MAILHQLVCLVAVELSSRGGFRKSGLSSAVERWCLGRLWSWDGAMTEWEIDGCCPEWLDGLCLGPNWIFVYLFSATKKYPNYITWEQKPYFEYFMKPVNLIIFILILFFKNNLQASPTFGPRVSWFFCFSFWWSLALSSIKQGDGRTWASAPGEWSPCGHPGLWLWRRGVSLAPGLYMGGHIRRIVQTEGNRSSCPALLYLTLGKAVVPSTTQSPCQ